SEFDDWLLEELVEDREPPSDALYAISSRVLSENSIIPVLIGSASHGNGMTRLSRRFFMSTTLQRTSHCGRGGLSVE
ncbi:elongation factor G, partial [Rhizobium leguminosarum]